jgi:hypothetical protein
VKAEGERLSWERRPTVVGRNYVAATRFKRLKGPHTKITKGAKAETEDSETLPADGAADDAEMLGLEARSHV